MKKHNHTLVLGKFLHLHKGHIELIKQAIRLGKKTTVMVCVAGTDDTEVGPRLAILRKEFGYQIDLDYVLTEAEGLSNKEESCPDVSLQYAEFIHKQYKGSVDCIVGSEDYIRYMGETDFIKDYHIYDMDRTNNPVSSTQVRNGDKENYCNEAKHYLTPVFGLIGPESSGKTTMAAMLAEEFGGTHQKELARNYMDDEFYTERDLEKFAMADHILTTGLVSSGDTSPIFRDNTAKTTKAYARMSRVNSGIINEIARTEDITHYLIFAPDCEFVQDGTRTQSQQDRELMYGLLKSYMISTNATYTIINGADWETRKQKVIDDVRTVLSR